MTTLYLNSQNAINRLTNTNYDLQYMINWDSILPPNVRKFKLSFSFISVHTTDILTEHMLIDVNINSNMFAQNLSKSHVIGYGYMVEDGTAYSYRAKHNENIPVYISRPTNNTLEVRMLNLDGTLDTSYDYDYVLMLDFE